MARGVNKVILVGNLGNDPEIFYTQAGAPITSISVATSESWKDKETGQQQERTEWHKVKFFGRLAEIAAEYLTKGRQVYIEGSLRTNVVEKDGVKKHFTEVIANEMQMLGGNKGEGGGENQQSRARQQDRTGAPATKQAPARNNDFPDDDIPF